MKRKTKTQEIFSHRVQFRTPGGVWVWVKGAGQTMDPDQATIFSDKYRAEDIARNIQSPRSSLQARVVSTPIKPERDKGRTTEYNSLPNMRSQMRYLANHGWRMTSETGSLQSRLSQTWKRKEETQKLIYVGG